MTKSGRPGDTSDQPSPPIESQGDQRVQRPPQATGGDPPATKAALDAQSEKPVAVVGLGASAGGLSAFEAFFSAIPRKAQTGLAFVLVQHLAPDHKSILTELIRRYTSMQVREVEDGMSIRPDCAYIIPPNRDMGLFQGKLHLLEPAQPHGLRLPIDFFFRSLADDQHERAICVLLSGTGSDGTLGARAVKGEGGLVMVQSPTTAAYDSMPRTLIDNGLADVILPPSEMPERLIAYVAHTFRKTPGTRPPAVKTEDALTKICLILRDATRHDFSHYKQSTLVRRIERRMAMHQIERQDDYVRYLQREAVEVQLLFRDLLIGVTSFFRDPDAFAVLQSDIVPRLFKGKAAGSIIRIWVCGCSTGEEAYSIAILVHEHLEVLKQSFQVQIFATDVDDRAIAQARIGAYPASIAADVSAERLARFFVLDQDAGIYRIQRMIRDLVVFSEQNLIRDPPFSRIDFISCRNLLIYFNGSLQRKVIPLFHYALKPEGLLFLGSSETIGDNQALFTPLDRKWKLYARLTPSSNRLPPQLAEVDLQAPADAEPSPASPGEPRLPGLDLRALAEGALLQHFNATGVLTNTKGDICYIHGRTGYYLEPAAGKANMNVLQMARDGLKRPLTAALQRAVARQDIAKAPGISVRTNGGVSVVDLFVRPVGAASRSDKESVRADFYLVIFDRVAEAASEPTSPAAQQPPAKGEAPPDPARDRRIAELELELRAKEEYLQTTLEEMETSNEELKSTNEEMQSVNEELQSTNEELETSKEELQSVNEELATVNAELQTKVADLSRANNDMNNLLAGTGVATLFVDQELRISRFTPTMTRIIKLIPSDIGRPVGDIVSNLLDYKELVDDITTVLHDLVPKELAVQSTEGVWYLMRIGPYRTLDNVIEGAVMTFVDITSRKRMEDDLREARAFAEAVVETVRDPLLVLDEQDAVISANPAFYRHFQMVEAETRGRSLFSLGDGQWETPELRQLIAETRRSGKSFDGYRMDHEFPNLGRRIMQLNARRLSRHSGPAGAVLLAFEDLGAPGSATTSEPDPS